MRLFLEHRELIQFARRFISERINSLEKDVRHCLFQSGQYAPAPFPALLYCFATIDFLGSLHSGNATKNAPTTRQSREYMRKFMHYTADQSEILQELFRHKLVHLAQPNPIVDYHGRRITWCYYHENAEKHLRIDKLQEKEKIQVTPSLSIEYEEVFNLSIMSLVQDIINSVLSPNGYLALLERTPDLQDRFEQAVSHIYD